MTDPSDNNRLPGSDDRLIGPANRQASDDDGGSPSPAGQPTATVHREAAARTPKRVSHYHVKGVLASGGMGIGYEARKVSLNRTVALEALEGSLGLTSKAVVRFGREAEAVAKLHYSSIVPTYATGESS
jgi:serine/threonine protein kinase